MEQDLSLFRSVLDGSREATFRVYNWDRPAVTIGHHQARFTPRDEGLSLPVVKRPTGGGAVLHGDDLTFSICAPENGPFPGGITGACTEISRIFARCLRDMGLDARIQGDSKSFSEICFQRSSPVELCLDGRKIMGLAMLRRSGCILVQGVIPLRVDASLASRVFGKEHGSTEGLCDRLPWLDPAELIDRLMAAFSA
jgi:lipoate-protein ligase A